MDSDRENLRRIANISRKINSLCSESPNSIPELHHQQAYINAPVPPLVLPMPEGIVHSLMNTGCSLSLAKSLSDTFIQSAHKIRAMYESIHHRQLERLASDPDTLTSVKALGQAVERQFQQQLRFVEQLAVERGRTLQITTPPSATPIKTKTSFNQEFVPFLEKYFEYNAYPSAPDRVSLAIKSMMTPRQIEVWFQNHRNRAKKEGKILRRLTSDPLPLKVSLESLEESMPLFIIPEKDRKDPFPANASEHDLGDDSDGDEAPSVHQVHATFSNTAPLHAFPTTYPPATRYEPFPKECKFSAPVWMRNRVTTAVVPPPILDIEELIAEFTAKLTIRDVPSKKLERAGPTPSMTIKQPWFAATHTTPPSAPHPALIRSSSHPESISLPTIPTIAAPLSCMHPFRSPSPFSYPVTLAPSSNDKVTRRKVARLPKRTPNHPSTTYRGASPATSQVSPFPSSRSLTPSSRTSSFSLDDSFFRRPSSSSSSSSTASSTLTTPVFSPTSLPEENVPSPISISGIDFQSIDDLFGGSPNAMSPLDALNSSPHLHSSFNVPTKLGKDIIFQFGFETPATRLE